MLPFNLKMSHTSQLFPWLDYKNAPFTKRIKRRHKTFWTSPDAEEFRNTPLQKFGSLANLKQQPNWQRVLSNKANAMHFAAMHGCKTPLIYWRGRNVESINFSALPPQFVIKPTIGHSCNNVFLMDNGYNHMDKKRYTYYELTENMKQIMESNPLNEILIQEFLTSESGEYRIPTDYKVHTFNGEIARIEVIYRTGPGKGTVNVFDTNWEPKENIGKKYVNGDDLAPPKCLPQIINQAKTLSKAYQIYVRIDFYATAKGAVFGEFTPTPGIGIGFTNKADRLFTFYWDEYCEGMI
ncbi:hypothetical protein EOD41_11745 [Mucilaginibacter limnophilus]|uniref:ATP-grasp domain-containing protein n=1 Tax=Mucilaginibacter limnophilus TaxID=1932778 RepID=A0A437MSP6_9SPHI|nr:ATP-grasp fold amidoligase family protein [Mucilaginibacter limnophilus]RVU00666.1 hypothetical protein EOD41_11745 [Mucilaginibacter limnophilus]